MPSRISGACNACRAKKQKCSGDRSGCVQCRAADQQCTWPAQRKRGPAKGYIEGLEHRLRDTESLLLQVLPVVPEDYLEAITRDSDRSSGRSMTLIRRPMLNNKTGVDYWDQFPLDSVENIRRWQQDCSEGQSPYHTSAQSSQERQSPAKLEMDAMAPVDWRLSQYQQSAAPSADVLVSTENPSPQNIQAWSGTNTTTAGTMLIGQTASSSLDVASWSQVGDMNMEGQLPPSSSKAYVGRYEPDRVKNSADSPLYPTDFQRQFFW